MHPNGLVWHNSGHYTVRKEWPTMFTEKALPKHPSLIRAFMGLPAEIFWQLIADIQTR